MRRSAGKTLAALALALPTGLAVAGPAVAQPLAASSVGCVASGCTGKDPIQMGCSSDAVSLDTVSDDPWGITLELRWSNACQASWARLSGADSNVYEVGLINSNGDEQVWHPAAGVTSGWTMMVMNRSNVDKAHAWAQDNVAFVPVLTKEY
ncbi:DUF2690 domain-containing protein [Streptomyces sp. NBC_00079]|uniref:DUF2690 domain-containing protein n=1 Tax=Streptomyces sp. NBC_00079 TaxID=2975644 RepID=UPI0032548B1A